MASLGRNCILGEVRMEMTDLQAKHTDIKLLCDSLNNMNGWMQNNI